MEIEAQNAGLSAPESRIAELVARGLTNREVAATLDVSAKTVEWKLTKIYRVLDVRSRTELAARYGQLITRMNTETTSARQPSKTGRRQPTRERGANG